LPLLCPHKYRSGEITISGAIRDFLEKILKTESELNAVVLVRETEKPEIKVETRPGYGTPLAA